MFSLMFINFSLEYLRNISFLSFLNLIVVVFFVLFVFSSIKSHIKRKQKKKIWANLCHLRHNAETKFTILDE